MVSTLMPQMSSRLKPSGGVLSLQRENCRAVGQQAVVAAGTRGPSLVKQLKVARVDSHGLVGVPANQVTVADVVGPGSTAVGLASKGVALGRGLGRPRSAETGSRERAEVAAIGADSLDDHEVLLLALDGVHLDSLEEVVGRVAHNNRRGGAKVTREVSDGHARAIDLAIVACEE